MDTILITLIVVLLVLNILVVFFLLRNKQQKTEDPTQAFKNEFNSFKDTLFIELINYYSNSNVENLEKDII